MIKTPWDSKIERLKTHIYRSSGETRILATLEAQASAYFQGATDEQERYELLVNACKALMDDMYKEKPLSSAFVQLALNKLEETPK